jgi:hypothetical protein
MVSNIILFDTFTVRLQRPCPIACHKRPHRLRNASASMSQQSLVATCNEADSPPPAITNSHTVESQSEQLQLRLPGAQSFATFVSLWDTLTARLLPLHSSGASAEMLLAAIRLLLATADNQTASPRLSSGSVAPHDHSSASSLPAKQVDKGTPKTLQQLLGVALHLADLSSAGLPLDTATIAAGVLAEPLCSGRLRLATVAATVGPEVARLLEHLAAVHSLPAAVDVYEDSTCR